MDFSKMKSLGEDKEATKHSGSDVKAFAAARNSVVEKRDGGRNNEGGSEKMERFFQTGCLNTSGFTQEPIIDNGNERGISRTTMKKLLIETLIKNRHHPSEAMGLSRRKPSFVLLIPYIFPLLEEDERLELQALEQKFTENEITKEVFFRRMRTILGNKTLNMDRFKRDQNFTMMKQVPTLQQNEAKMTESMSQMDYNCLDDFEWIEGGDASSPHGNEKCGLKEELERLRRLNSVMEVELGECKAESDLLVDKNMVLKQELENVKVENEKFISRCSKILWHFLVEKPS